MTKDEAITALDYLAKCTPLSSHYTLALQMGIEAIERREIVRCKDCKFWDITSPMATVIPVPCRCGLRRDHEATLETDFCSYAVRREEKEEWTE